jgi:hypothetical protein
MQEIEIWKPVNGLSGFMVSSFGNVTGIRGKPYKMSKNKKGYHILRSPIRKYGKQLHRIVAEHFIGKIPNGYQVNHKDGDKSNNRASNLEFMTCSENIRHAIKLGLRAANQNLKSSAMFDKSQVIAIKDAIAAGHGNQEISNYFKCHHSTISKIRTGINYAR